MAVFQLVMGITQLGEEQSSLVQSIGGKSIQQS